MITVKQRGDFHHAENFFQRVKNLNIKAKLAKYGREGIEALEAATPRRTGKTASSWEYEIVENTSSLSIIWRNTNVNRGVNIALILQMGHGTRNGGYVKGVDYINPALQPVFDAIAENVWKEVTSA